MFLSKSSATRGSHAPPADATRNDAVLALRRFRNNGSALDPAISDHLNAYLVVRRTMGRVDPDKVVAYLASAKDKIEHGAESYSKY